MAAIISSAHLCRSWAWSPPLGSDFLVALPKLPAACSVSFEQRNVSSSTPKWDFFKNKKAVFLSSVTLALRLCLLSPNFQQQLPTEAAACVCRFKWLAPQRPPGCGAGWGCVGPPPWDPPGPHCWAGAAVMGVGSAAGCCGVPPIKGVIAGLARQRCSLIRGVQGFALQSSRI